MYVFIHVYPGVYIAAISFLMQLQTAHMAPKSNFIQETFLRAWYMSLLPQERTCKTPCFGHVKAEVDFC